MSDHQPQHYPLFSVTGDGVGDLSDIYRLHFNKVDRFNASFYEVGPPTTKLSEAIRIYLDLLLIRFLNAHALHVLHQAKLNPSVKTPSHKQSLHELIYTSE